MNEKVTMSPNTYQSIPQNIIQSLLFDNLKLTRLEKELKKKV